MRKSKLLFSTILAISLATVGANVAEPINNISITKAAESEIVSSGSFQPGVVWTLYDNNTLHIKSEYSDTVWSSGTVVDKLGKETAGKITKVVFDNTIKVSKLDSTFKDMTSLESINTGMLYADTRDSDNKIKDAPGTTGIPAGITMNETFMNCKKLKSLDLRGLDPSILVGTSSSISGYIYNFNATMFVGCTALETVQFNDYSQYSNVSPAVCYRMAVISSKLNYASYSDGALKDAEIFNTATGKVRTIDYGLNKYISGATYYSGVYYNLLDYTCGNCYKYSWSLKEGNTKNASYTWSPRKFEVTYKKIAHHPLSKDSDTATESTVTTSVQTASQNLTLLSGNAKLASVDTFYNSDSFYNVAWKCNLVGYITETDKDKLKDLQNNTAYPQSKEYYDALKKVFITEINTDTYEPVYKSNRLTTNAYSPIIDGMTIYAIYETQDVIDKYFNGISSPDTTHETHTISFVDDEFPAITINDGEAIFNLPVPEPTSGTFTGWVTKDGVEIENGYIPTSDLELHATYVGAPDIPLPEPENPTSDNPTSDNPGSSNTDDDITPSLDDKENNPEDKVSEKDVKKEDDITPKTEAPTNTTQETNNLTDTKVQSVPTITNEKAKEESVDTKVTSLTKVKGLKGKNKKGRKVYLTWEAVNGAKEYQFQIAMSKNMKKYKKSVNTPLPKITTSKLKKGKTFYFRVRAVNGKIKGKWSKVIKVKIKK